MSEERIANRLSRLIAKECIKATARGVQPHNVAAILVGCLYGVLREFGTDREEAAAQIHALADDVKEKL